MNLIYYLLSLISGTFLTIQVSLNGKLRTAMGSPIFASLISFAVGTAGLAAALAFTLVSRSQPAPAWAGARQTQWWMWIGGLLGAFYVVTAIVSSPRIGFANMFSLVIAGQIIMAVLIDQFGALGYPPHTINPIRIAGIMLLIVSVYIIQTH